MTRDPELRYTAKGVAVAKFSIATNRNWKTESGEQKEEVTFVECVSFGNTAEAIGQYFKKGKPMFLEGRLRLETWEDKQTGQNRQKLSVIVESFQFVEKKGDAKPAAKPSAKGGKKADKAPEPTTEAETDDVPF